MIRNFGDRLLLLLCALVVGALLLGWMFVSDRVLGLTRELHLFVGGALTYSVTTLYLMWHFVLKDLKRLTGRAVAVIIVECPVVVFFILFKAGVVPWPLSMLPYVAGTVVIAPLMVVGIDWLFRSKEKNER